LLGVVTVTAVGLLVIPTLMTPGLFGGDRQPSPSPRGSAQSSDPLDLRQDEVIVFASDRDGDYDLYALRYGDHEPHRLGEDTGRDERSPAISPDGTTVAFVVGRESSRDIWLMDTDGSRLRPLTLHPADDTDPAWSSDGQRLAFASRRSDIMYDIWEIRTRDGRLDQATARNLTDRAAVEHFPDWIPRSTELLIASNHQGANRDIWRIDASDGDSLGRLTSSFDYDFEPAISPGGETVAFYRRPYCALCDDSRGPADLMLMTITGRNERQLTELPGRDEVDPAWSPDGRAIAYSSGSFRSLTGPVEDGELMVTTPDGGRRKRLTHGWEHVAEPSWGRVPTSPGRASSATALPRASP
jgi:Tol biopolymer transport system component